MKVSCLQENLAKGLGLVGRAVATRTTLPITNNVLLVAEESRLKLAATNLEISITSWIGAKVEEQGAITVPARLLSDFVSTLPAERIDMTLLQRNRVLQLQCARFEARIHGMDASDFPQIPSHVEGIATRIDPEALRESIARVAFAAATEDSRPVLTGVHAEFNGDQVTLAAADGFRLSVDTKRLESPVAEKTAVIIPARSLVELNRLLGDQEEPVEVLINPNRSQVLFRLKSAEMVSQLIQGNFPNYSQLIPQKFSTRTVVEAGEFVRATKTASIFARDASGIIRLQATPGEGGMAGRISISARAEEVGENLGELDAVVEGEAAKVAFNSRYLSEILTVLDKGQIALETTTPSSPGVIRPVGSEGYLHVVMPMFVQW